MDGNFKIFKDETIGDTRYISAYPAGVCSRQIDIELKEGIVQNIRFYGGCSGNTQGIAALARGRSAKELAERLSGIRCGNKCTSCPDQLARILKSSV